MAAGLVIPTSGPYVGLFNALALGTQDDNGFNLGYTPQGQIIDASDAYGMTFVEGIYRGGNWTLGLNGLEWQRTGLQNALQMFGNVTGGFSSLTPTLANVGQRLSTFAKTLLLTAILSNPPTTPQTLTAETATLTPQSQTLFQMTSKMREMPLQFSLLPYATVIGSVTFNVPFLVT